jgi:hypothetical protein
VLVETGELFMKKAVEESNHPYLRVHLQLKPRRYEPLAGVRIKDQRGHDSQKGPKGVLGIDFIKY